MSDLEVLEDRLEDTRHKLQVLINKYPNTSLIHEVLTQFQKDTEDMKGIINE
tara:strand:- start:700 stop:855 length:156 start_codon:yes stop_codon:yes gene_type:complete